MPHDDHYQRIVLAAASLGGAQKELTEHALNAANEHDDLARCYTIAYNALTSLLAQLCDHIAPGQHEHVISLLRGECYAALSQMDGAERGAAELGIEAEAEPVTADEVLAVAIAPGGDTRQVALPFGKKAGGAPAAPKSRAKRRKPAAAKRETAEPPAAAAPPGVPLVGGEAAVCPQCGETAVWWDSELRQVRCRSCSHDASADYPPAPGQVLGDAKSEGADARATAGVADTTGLARIGANPAAADGDEAAPAPRRRPRS